MSVTPLDAPRPLPSVPCPVFDGRPVQWEAWAAAIPVTHVDPSCSACAFPGPLSTAVGKLMPHPGETVRSTRVKQLRSGRGYEKPATVPAWPIIGLYAFLCPSCFHLDMFGGIDGARARRPVEIILCDGCDAACAAGIDDAEARRNLVDLYGGWSSPGADWDLCRACNPAASPDAPPRALAAFAASRTQAKPKR